MHANIDECEAAGLDPDKVEKIAAGLSRYAKQAQALGIGIFGASGSGELRFRDHDDKGPLKVASLSGDFDGGDGADYDWGDGLLRGE